MPHVARRLPEVEGIRIMGDDDTALSKSECGLLHVIRSEKADFLRGGDYNSAAA